VRPLINYINRQITKCCLQNYLVLENNFTLPYLLRLPSKHTLDNLPTNKQVLLYVFSLRFDRRSRGSDTLIFFAAIASLVQTSES